MRSRANWTLAEILWRRGVPSHRIAQQVQAPTAQSVRAYARRHGWPKRRPGRPCSFESHIKFAA